MTILLLFIILLPFFLFYLFFRINRVSDYRISVINNESLEEYEKLPSFGYMMSRFWVWPLSEFKIDDEL